MSLQLDFLTGKKIESFYSPTQYFGTKTLDDLPQNVLKEIKMVSLPDRENPIGQPFGSFINRSTDYYGDIDVIQIYKECCTKEEVGKKAAKAIQDITKSIAKKEDHYFSELKAGVDKLYLFNIGTLVNGIYTVSPLFERKCNILHAGKLLSNAEMSVIKSVLEKPFQLRNGDDYDTIFNLFREHWLLRWSSKEVLQGYKVLPRNGSTSIRYPLEEAVIDKGILKIDMIIILDGRFLEVTNFIALGLAGKSKFKPINIDVENLSPLQLTQEIEKLYYSSYHFKPFKLVKRAFAYLKHLYNNWDKKKSDPETEAYYTRLSLNGITKQSIVSTIEKYIEILESTVNILYTCNSELDAIKLVLERVSSPPIAKINQRLDNLKTPLANVLELDEDILSMLVAELDKCRKASRGKKAECIEKLMKINKKIIDNWTLVYFQYLGINPPPQIVLPFTMAYNPDIVREPGLSGGTTPAQAFQKLSNKIRKSNPKSRKLEVGEYHVPYHNWSGPGTRVAKYPDSEPVNNIDKCSRTHDYDYNWIQNNVPDELRAQYVNDADIRAVECYDKYPNEQGYNYARNGIAYKVKTGKLPPLNRLIFGEFPNVPGYLKGINATKLPKDFVPIPEYPLNRPDIFDTANPIINYTQPFDTANPPRILDPIPEFRKPPKKPKPAKLPKEAKKQAKKKEKTSTAVIVRPKQILKPAPAKAPRKPARKPPRKPKQEPAKAPEQKAPGTEFARYVPPPMAKIGVKQKPGPKNVFLEGGRRTMILA